MAIYQRNNQGAIAEDDIDTDWHERIRRAVETFSYGGLSDRDDLREMHRIEWDWGIWESRTRQAAMTPQEWNAYWEGYDGP